MDANQKALLAAAVNVLIEDADAVVMYRQLLGVYELARKDFPVRLTGRTAVLNPVLELMLSDYPASERVLELIERKRSEAGFDPLVVDTFDRQTYMRDLMAAKRERQRRLVDLFNELRSEHDKIKGASRMEFERMHAARWQDVRLEREEALREQLGHRLTKEQRQKIISDLWDEVDQELDALEAFVRQEVRKPLHARAPDGFKFKLKPKKGTA